MQPDDTARPDVDVLVVGAGPTGLTLAAYLRAYDVRVRLVDRGADRVHESRALAIQPRTLEVLAGLDVTAPLLDLGNRAVRLAMHLTGRVVAVPLFDLGLDDSAYPFLLFLSQAETERVLGERLTSLGGAVERRTALTGLTDDGGAVRATLRRDDGTTETVSARYVVGCDGAHSTVRELTGIPFTGAAYPQTFVLADVEADGVETGVAHTFISERGMLFLFPLGTPATWRVVAMRPRADAPPPDAPVTLDEVQRLVDAYAGGAVRLRDPVWMTNFRIHNRGARRYRAGRVFLAGDAAHIHSPAGAQGMNTGIQDAVNLGWKLAATIAGQADPAVLDTYERERAPIGRRVLRFTDRAFTIATSTSSVLRYARSRIAPRVAPLALRLGAGRRYLFRTISELGIAYRDSPLSARGGGRGPGPRAGDRLPDGAVERSGAGTRLHAVLGGRDWHVLLCGPPAYWPPAVRGRLAARCGPAVRVVLLAEPLPGGAEPAGDAPVLTDPDGALLRRLGVRPDRPAVLLVRPDGHLAYRGHDAEIVPVLSCLDRWLPGRPTG